MQETLTTALDRWPLTGVPDRPGVWLTTACRTRARNIDRDRDRADRRVRAARPLLIDDGAGPVEQPAILDDRQRLIIMCCDPLLAPDALLTLTLRMVAGLSNEEIARGFHLPAATPSVERAIASPTSSAPGGAPRRSGVRRRAGRAGTSLK